MGEKKVRMMNFEDNPEHVQQYIKISTKHFTTYWYKEAIKRDTTVGKMKVPVELISFVIRAEQLGILTSTNIKKLVAKLAEDPTTDPIYFILQEEMTTVYSPKQIEIWTKESIQENTKSIKDILSKGKKSKKAYSFLKGAIMRKSNFRADNEVLEYVLETHLNGD